MREMAKHAEPVELVDAAAGYEKKEEPCPPPPPPRVEEAKVVEQRAEPCPETAAAAASVAEHGETSLAINGHH